MTAAVSDRRRRGNRTRNIRLRIFRAGIVRGTPGFPRPTDTRR